MKPTPSLSINVEKKGDLFFATCSEFPEVTGQGVSPEEARDAVVERLEKYRFDVGSLEAHPLCPTLIEWFNTSRKPEVEFKPEEEFLETLGSLNCDETVKRGIYEIYCHTEVLGQALVADDYNEDIHQCLYTISGHPLGFSLIVAAGLASNIPDYFVSFAKSMHLPGFVAALEAWALCNEQLEPFDGSKELKYIHRNIVRLDHPAARFWQNACQDSFGDIKAFNSAMAKEVMAAEAADRNSKKRQDAGVSPRDAEFLNLIKGGWVPAALWCMDASEIVSTIAPEKREGMVEAYDKVRRNISTLKYTKSWKRTGG